MHRLLPVLFLITIFSGTVHDSLAQRRIHLAAHAGITIGSPYDTPPEGATGQPGIGPSWGGEVSLDLWKNWRILTGLYYAEKGSTFQSPVEGTYNAADGSFGFTLPFAINVDYTGTVTGSYRNRYLDIPLVMTYQPTKWISVGLGYQYSHLLTGRMKGSVDVRAVGLTFEDQPFDQSDLIYDQDQAFLFDINGHFLRIFEIKIRTGIGLTPMMAEDPEGFGRPKNYYVAMMVGARL